MPTVSSAPTERHAQAEHDRDGDEQDRLETSTSTSRSTRPSSRPSRLAGVTRIRSTTPNRISAMMPNPTNSVPNMPSWMSRPGTKTCQELPGGKPGARVSGFEQRPEQRRDRAAAGSVPATTHTGSRSMSRIC